MRKITWNMLHPDLQSWLLDKERRIINLERWRRTKADPMLDDHERRIGSCESQISSLWSKLGDTEDQLESVAKNAIGAGTFKILEWWFSADTTGIINPHISQYSGNISVSFNMTPGFTSGLVEIKTTMNLTILFTHNVSNAIYIPIGPMAQVESDTSMHRHFGFGEGGSIVFSSNTEFYWNSLIIFDPFPCHIDVWAPGFPGTVFRPCFPYAYFTVKVPNNLLSIQISGFSHYNSLDVKTFKTFDVSKLYNNADGGYFYSLPNPRDMLTSIIVI